jgi:hypothetical protein
LSEEEAEAKAFEEIKKIMGLPDDLNHIAHTRSSNRQKHRFFWFKILKFVVTTAVDYYSNSRC